MPTSQVQTQVVFAGKQYLENNGQAMKQPIGFDGMIMRKRGLTYLLQSPTTRLCTLDGSAFARVSEEDLTNYIGSYVEFVDNAGKIAAGYIKEADAGEALGAELVTNGDMELDANWNNYGTPTTNERSLEQANNGTYSRKFTTDAIYEGIQCNSNRWSVTSGKLYKADFYIYPVNKTLIRAGIYRGDGGGWVTSVGGDFTGLMANAWNLVNIYYITISTGSQTHILILSGPAEPIGTWYIDNVSVKEVTHIGADGVHIVSASGGATRNWTSIDTGFDPNAIASVYVY